MTKIVTIIAVVMLILTIGIVSAQDNGTSADTAEILKAPTSDLQAKIDNASEGDTIEIDEESFHPGDDKFITINKSITIQGKEKTRPDAGIGVNINITQGNVIFRNLNFTGYVGAYLITCSGNLTVENTTFSGVDRCIESTGNLKLKDCEFEKGYSIHASNAEIINCTFDSENYADITADGDYLEILNSTIRNYTHITSSTSKTRITNSRLWGNAKRQSQTVVSCRDFEFVKSEIGNSTFRITAKTAELNGCDISSGITLKSNSSTVKGCNFTGPSLRTEGNSTIIDDCNFTNCKVEGIMKLFEMDGCSVWLGSVGAYNDADVKNSVYLKNSNFSKAGFEADTDYISLDNCSFADLNTSKSPLALLSNGPQVEITNSRFINNTCQQRLISDCGFISLLKITDNTFINNTCPELLSWDLTLDYDSRRETWTKSPVEISFSNNILINNLDRDGNYAPCSFFATVLYNYDAPKTALDIRADNNFFGFNMPDRREMCLFEILKSNEHMSKQNAIVNLDMTGSGDEYTLRFIDSQGKLIALPDCVFNIQERNTGKIIAGNVTVKNGSATFASNRTPDEIFIINEAGEIVNKPQANLTWIIAGDSFEDMIIEATLQNGTDILKDQKVYFEVNRKYPDGVTIPEYVILKTDSNGRVILYETSDYRKTYTTFDFAQDGIAQDNLTVLFASRQFGLSKLEYPNFKVKKTELEVTAKDITTTYNVQPTLTITAVSKKTKMPVLYASSMGYIYKGSKRVKTMYLEYTSKVTKYKLPKLDAGTYKIIIKHGYGSHTFQDVTVTLKVNKIKASVKAPKVTAKYKKSKYFKVTVKAGKKPLKKVVLKVKVGKKTYKVKTDSKGVAKLNTKKLKVGKHKVVISSANANYQITAKSKITIKR